MPPRRLPKGYTPNDASVGDLDGDGEYEIVVHRTVAAATTRSAAPTDQPILEALQARRHAPLADQPRQEHPRGRALHAVHGLRPRRRRHGRGRLQDRRRHRRRRGQGHRRRRAPTTATPTATSSTGPEFLTVFDGRTGAALATTTTSRRGDRRWRGSAATGGDDSTATASTASSPASPTSTASHPSLVMCRGYYTRTVLAAWDWRDGKLTRALDLRQRRRHADGNRAYRGQGNHKLSRRRRRRRRHGRDRLRRLRDRRRRQGPLLHRPRPRRRAARRPTSIPTARAWRSSASTRTSAAHGASTRAELARRADRPVDLAAEPTARTSAAASSLDIDPRHRGYEMWGGRRGFAASGTRRASRSARRQPRVRATSASGGTATCSASSSTATTISKWDWQAGTRRHALHRRRLRVEQRHQGHPRASAPTSSATGARKSSSAVDRQPGAAHLHDDHPHASTASTR